MHKTENRQGASVYRRMQMHDRSCKVVTGKGEAAGKGGELRKPQKKKKKEQGRFAAEWERRLGAEDEAEGDWL